MPSKLAQTITLLTCFVHISAGDATLLPAAFVVFFILSRPMPMYHLDTGYGRLIPNFLKFTISDFGWLVYDPVTYCRIAGRSMEDALEMIKDEARLI
jgi:hypothetical protein